MQSDKPGTPSMVTNQSQSTSYRTDQRIDGAGIPNGADTDTPYRASTILAVSRLLVVENRVRE